MYNVLKHGGKESTHVADNVAGEPRDGGGTKREVAEYIVENGENLHHTGYNGQQSTLENSGAVHCGQHRGKKHRGKQDAVSASEMLDVGVWAL